MLTWPRRRLDTLETLIMNSRSSLKPREDAGVATAIDGVVVLDGPDGVAVTMTADAAAQTADSLHAAANEARRHAGAGPDPTDELRAAP
jgi:hypothetical protein